MHYHLIGICGVSMSGLAQFLVAKGNKVTGSDLNSCHIVIPSEGKSRVEESLNTRDSSTPSSILRAGYFHSSRNDKKSNIKIYKGHSEKNITKDIDEVIYTKAVDNSSAAGFVELKKARELGIKTTSRSKFIGRLMNDKIGISITGMHGKTTVTTMISLVLEAAGYNPTCLVGSEVKEWGSNVRIGGRCHSERPQGVEESLLKSDFSTEASQTRLSSRNDKNSDCFADVRNDAKANQGLKFGKLDDYFVVETDESAKQLLDFRPKIAVITNLDREHLDTYKGDMPEIKQTFKKFIRLLPANGLLVVWQEDRNLMPLTKAAKCKVKRVSINKPWPGLKLKVPGKFNQLNVTLAARVCHELGVNHKTIKKVLNGFTGAKRRFEIKGEKNGITIIDDYGHHPTEIRNAIEAAREFMNNELPASRQGGRITNYELGIKPQISNDKNSKKLKIQEVYPVVNPKDSTTGAIKLIMVFQPHQQQRTKLLFNDFVKTFDGVDELIITDVYLIAGREKDTGDNLAKKLVEEIKKRNVNVKYIESVNNYQKIIDYLKANTKKGDLVITQGATDIYKVGEELLKQ